MPAASRGERRGPVRPRTQSSPKRARPRAVDPATQGLSTPRAARKRGFPLGLITAGLLTIAALALAAFLATDARAARLRAFGREAVDSRFASLGLKLGVVHLQGASAAAQDEILQAAALKPGTPILTVDLDAVRARVERVGWVASARVIRLLPDTIVVAVVERPLMAVWQHAGRSVVVANDGAIVGAVDPTRFPRLPLIVGDGANLAAGELLTALGHDRNFAGRVQALIRVDQRRWISQRL